MQPGPEEPAPPSARSRHGPHCTLGKTAQTVPMPRPALLHPLRHLATAIFALGLIVLSVWMLERDRAGLRIDSFVLGTTPVTLYERPGVRGPAVVVVHGFAGSRQIMQGYSLRLAQAGYRVLAFDFEGHGRNPVPMRGDVTSVDGTTVLLMAETQRVIAAARALPDVPGVALLGHSMATDILVRTANAESEAGRPVAAVVAISMFSQAVDETEPPRLLAISGAWEGSLRAVALEAVQLVDPKAQEGALAQAGAVERKAVVAPAVGHVGVLYSPEAIAATRDWLDETFGWQPPEGGTERPGQMGRWILLLLFGIVLAFHPLAALLPKAPLPPSAPVPLSPRRFWLVTLAPAVLVPLGLVAIYRQVLPVVAVDYLTLHLALYGLVQLGALRLWHALPRPILPGPAPIVGAVVFLLWGVGGFGLAADRYGANFWPSPERAGLIALMTLGTVPFFLADAHLTGAGQGALWRRVVARLVALASLVLATALAPANLMFVAVAVPAILAFWLVQGLMGRWLARRAGPVAAGLGLGLGLAWVLGIGLPLLAV